MALNLKSIAPRSLSIVILAVATWFIYKGARNGNFDTRSYSNIAKQPFFVLFLLLVLLLFYVRKRASDRIRRQQAFTPHLWLSYREIRNKYATIYGKDRYYYILRYAPLIAMTCLFLWAMTSN